MSARTTALLCLPAVLLGIVCFTLSPYAFNVSALLHMDERTHAVVAQDRGMVVLQVPAYDGVQYYLIARQFGNLFSAAGWNTLETSLPQAYAYQRILLPAVAWVFSFGGKASLLPGVLLAINLLSLCATAWLLRAKPLSALALALCPAAMVGLHFSLAEPLTLLLVTAFLLRYLRAYRVGTAEVLLLCALVLTREVNIFFAFAVGVHQLLRRDIPQAGFCLLPAACFLAWHAVIYGIFGDIPFLWSAEKNALPFVTPWLLATGAYGYGVMSLSSLTLLFTFVLPATLWLLWRMKAGARGFLPVAALAFFFLMFSMPDHIWSSITSIGRVITPVYPLFVFAADAADTPYSRFLRAILIGLGLAAALGLGMTLHPFIIS